MFKKIQHFIEATALTILFSIFRLLPLDSASTIGGILARIIGPFLSAHKIAEKNLAEFFPTLSKHDRNKILHDMWDNLGRVAGELPHLPTQKLINRIQINGAEYIQKHKETSFFFSGHIGNWELLSAAALSKGCPVNIIYREANNKLVDNIITRIRTTRCAAAIPKGRNGAIKIARLIKNKEAIAMLVDQKMNDGIPVPFFGRNAMTAPAIADLALRYDMPIIPARVMRLHGAHFQATVYPPITFIKTGDHEKDVLAIMTTINSILENWIREKPAQWFWVHKRWPN